MVDPNLANLYHIQTGILAITAVVWVVCALSALSGYLSFRQRLDLGWVSAFALLALARALDAYTAWQTAALAVDMRSATVTMIEYLGYFRVRYAAVEMAAAFLVFVLFRARHLLVRRTSELT